MYNFALIDIAYSRITDGIRILNTTNTSCHLTLYWTDIIPRRHSRTRVVRGLEVPWYAYYCFVGWHAVPQIEAGDTLTHTFDLAPWLYCDTRWWIMKGTVAGIPSPSVSPIVRKHNSYHPLTKYEFYDTAYDTNMYTSLTVKLAQTFTPQADHEIAQVVLLLVRYGLPTIMNVAIEGTVPAGDPDDIILASGTFNTGDLPTGPTWNAIWLTIPLTPYELETGKKYAIVVYGGDDAKRVGWNAHTPNPYPRGRAWYWRPAPWFWWPAFNWDFLFEEWGYLI